MARTTFSSPELQSDPLFPLILRACRAAVTQLPDPGLAALLADVDAGRLSDRLARNRLRAIATSGLRRSDVRLPAKLDRADALVRRQATAFNLRSLGTAARVVRHLERHGVDVVILKGPLHQLRLFGDPFLRRSKDADLLVAPDQLGIATALLGEIGYRVQPDGDSLWWRRFLGERHFTCPGSALGVIDLHSRVQQPGCPAPRRTAEFLDRRVHIEWHGERLPVPSQDMAALLTAMSFVKALMHRAPAGAYAIELAALCHALASQPAKAASLEAAANRQGLTGTLRFARWAVAMLFEIPSDDPGRALGFAPGQLAAMTLDPGHAALQWPRRRTLLWRLCGGAPLPTRLRDYAREAGWALVAEAARAIGPHPEQHISPRTGGFAGSR